MFETPPPLSPKRLSPSLGRPTPLWLLLGYGALAAVLASCAADETPQDPWEDVELTELWKLGARGVGFAEQHDFESSAQAWSEVCELAPFWYVPRVNLGIATLNRGSEESENEAIRVFEQVRTAFPQNPWAHFCLGILRKRAGSLEQAEEHFRAVLALDPGDPDSYYHLGALLLETPGRAAEAAPLFRRALRANPVLISAWYGLAEAEGAANRPEERAAALREFQALRDGGGGVEREIVFGKMGFYADLIRPEDWSIPAPQAGPPAAAYSVVFSEVEPPPGLEHGGTGAGGVDFAAWVDGSAPPAEVSGGIAAGDLDADGDPDLLLAHWGPGPDVFALENLGAGWRAASSDFGFEPGDARTLALCLADFDGDGSLDVFLGRDGEDRIVARAESARTGPFVRALEGGGGGNEPTFAVRAGDLDQDGDLDLCVGKRSGYRLLRWDGAAFEDVTVESGVLAPGPGLGVLVADVDGDDDLDLAVGAPRPRVWLNDRLWRFREAPLNGFSGSDAPLASVGLGDADGDALVDWVAASPGAGVRVLLADVAGGYVPDGGWQAARAGGAPSGAFGAEFVDADRDGDLDVLTVGDRIELYLRNAEGGFDDWTEECGLARVDATGLRGHVQLDFDGDGDLDLAAVRNGRAPLLLRNDTGGAGGDDWVGVRPIGVLEPSRARGRAMGVGARVEVRAGNAVRVGYAGLGGGFLSSAPETLTFQLAGEQRADLRIVWPDQVVQSEFDLAGGRTHLIEQVDREASSCPLLFVWDGRHFEYVTDFLGVGGLGFLVEPGFYGPPDPEEVVRLGGQLVPKDGMLEVRVGEPMEEATFLDEATLIAVTHPPGTEVHPEEHFATAEPLASGRPLCIATDERVFPTSARASELPTDRSEAYRPADERAPEAERGPRDDRAALLEIDRDYSGPFRVHRRLLGYAGRWALELEFPAQATLLGDDPVHLYAFGWIEYPYSRLNYAAWQASLAMESLSLEVPDGAGGWRVVRPQFGYMAGKPRTMAVDISEHLAAARVGDRLRLRLSSNLSVHFDQLFLARDLSAHPGVLQVSERHPDEVVVAYAGFPREFTPDGADPPMFDYDHRDSASDFKAMVGNYTRFGEARHLLLERDDRFAIFGRGEELQLRFRPEAFPHLAGGEPGPEREVTWLFRARGYCKDMCPLTAEPRTLEPLPFAAMENYPPREPLGLDHPSRLSPHNRRHEPPRAPVR